MLKLRLAADKQSGEKKKYNGILDCLNQIVRKEGVTGIYKTFFLSLASILIYKCYYKAINKKLSSYLEDSDDLQKFGVAAASSALASVFSYPLDTVRARLALEAGDKDGKFEGTVDAANKMFNEEKWAQAFYRGISVNLCYLPVGLSPFAFRFIKQSLGLDNADPAAEIVADEE